MPDGDDEKDATIKQLNLDLSELRKKVRATDAENAQLKAAAEAHDQALAAAKAEGAREARAAADSEHARALARADLRVAAAKRLHDPDDAARYIEDAKVVNAEGKFDPAAAEAQLTALIEARPYLAAGAGGTSPKPPPGPPQGSADGGVRPPGGGHPDDPMNALLRAAVNKH
jgi:hypothetical protein